MRRTERAHNRQLKSRRHSMGLTLIELMIVLIIVAIVGGAGISSMYRMTVNNKITTQTNELIADINFTRSEAIKQGKRIAMLCQGAACQDADPSWNGGWVIFEDINGNGILDIDQNESVLREHDAIDNNIQINFNNDDIIIYNANGRIAGTAGTFTLRDLNGNGRNVTVSPAGRAKTETVINDSPTSG